MIKFSMFGWFGDGEAPAREDWPVLPASEVESWGMVQDDITGSKGAGAGKAWVGEGPDPVAVRAAAEAAAAERSPELAAAMARDFSFGNRLLLIGARAAGKAERALVRVSESRTGRRLVVSSASMADAAADATAALVFALRRHADGRGVAVDWAAKLVKGDRSRGARVRRRLGLTAWRAAYRSLTALGGGFVGRKGAGPVVTVPLDGAALDLEREGLAEWARGAVSVVPEGAASAARRAAGAWVWQVIVREATAAARGAARAEQVKAARARAVLVVRLIHGDSGAVAARWAGFKSWNVAAASIRRGGVFAALSVAARGNAERLLVVQAARTAARVAGAAAGAAVRVHRRAVGVRAPAAVAVTVPARVAMVRARAAARAAAVAAVVAAVRRLQAVRAVRVMRARGWVGSVAAVAVARLRFGVVRGGESWAAARASMLAVRAAVLRVGLEREGWRVAARSARTGRRVAVAAVASATVAAAAAVAAWRRVAGGSVRARFVAARAARVKAAAAVVVMARRRAVAAATAAARARLSGVPRRWVRLAERRAAVAMAGATAAERAAAAAERAQGRAVAVLSVSDQGARAARVGELVAAVGRDWTAAAAARGRAVAAARAAVRLEREGRAARAAELARCVRGIWTARD